MHTPETDADVAAVAAAVAVVAAASESGPENRKMWNVVNCM